MHGRDDYRRIIGALTDESGMAVVYFMLFVLIVGTVLSAIYLRTVKNVRQELIQKEVRQEKEIHTLVKEFYAAHSFDIDSDSSASINYGGGVVNTYSGLAALIGAPTRDAWNVPYKLYISERQKDPVGGFYYHRIYVVCLGQNHKLETGYDPATDKLSVGGDDTVVEIDGDKIEGNIYKLNRRKLSRLAAIIRGFAETLYLTKNKNKLLDFFVGSCAPNGGGVFGCYDVPTPVGQTNLPQEIGITEATYKDANGHDFLFDNYSSAVSTSIPPYTARVGLLMPGGYTEWIVFTYPI